MPESPRPYYTPPDPVRQLLAEITKPEAQLPALYGLIGEPLSGKTEAVRYLQHELEGREKTTEHNLRAYFLSDHADQYGFKEIYAELRQHRLLIRESEEQDTRKELEETLHSLEIKESHYVDPKSVPLKLLSDIRRIKSLLGSLPSNDSSRSTRLYILFDDLDTIPFGERKFALDLFDRMVSLGGQIAFVYTSRKLLGELGISIPKKLIVSEPEVLEPFRELPQDLWKQSLNHMRSLCTPHERNQVDQLLTLFAILPSAVEFDVLCALSLIDPDELRALLNKLSRWFPEDEDEYTIIHSSFCQYLRSHPAFAARIYRHRYRVEAYYRMPFQKQYQLDSVPSCVLRHLPEMFLATETGLEFLTQRYWLWQETLCKRYHKNTARQAFLRALNQIQVHSTATIHRVVQHSTLLFLNIAVYNPPPNNNLNPPINDDPDPPRERQPGWDQWIQDIRNLRGYTTGIERFDELLIEISAGWRTSEPLQAAREYVRLLQELTWLPLTNCLDTLSILASALHKNFEQPVIADLFRAIELFAQNHPDKIPKKRLESMNETLL